MPSQTDEHSIAVTLRVALLGGLALLLIWLLSDVLLVIFASVLMACVLHGGATKIHHWTGLGRGWSLLLLIVVVLAVFVGGFWLRGPMIAEQSGQIAQNFVQQGERLKEYALSTSWGTQLADKAGDGSGWSILGKLGSYVPKVANSLLGIVSTLVILVVTALFFAASPELYRDGMVRLLPISWRARGAEVLDGMGEALQLWFVGQLLDMIVVTILTGIGLYALGVPLAGTLALLAGLANFVPYIGALAGSIPALLVAAAQGPTVMAYTAI
ncbi:MAG: AI-2E family transporter, partial [Pseudomonadota bacterium]|nr:AI-2E family transporter [Pseudomonadota bacterium]